ncbi:MAG TPA: hypothetical protein VNU68_20905, partial [Verrucomicrobiae bacterium]|nr:hypothetical protein [Verrucomicrobiae bacterium]
VISHGIARIAEFLVGETAQVLAFGLVSPFLRGLGEEEILDEIRVILADSQRTTAYLTFSSQMRPSLHQFRLYGPRHGLLLDEDQQTLVTLSGKRLKSYAEKFLPPLTMAKQYVGNCLRNLRLFAANDFQMKSGMKFLIESFYQCITQGAPLPIPYREIILTSTVIDSVIAQLAPVQAPESVEEVSSQQA